MNLTEFSNIINNIDQSHLKVLKDSIDTHKHIILLGNGGSNAITCHIAQDYTKQLSKKAVCFGDSSRLTCYANDYGWSAAYAKFLEHFAEKDTLVILISSSGNSENILNAAEYCRMEGLNLITLSGFSQNNKLKTNYENYSLVHFWVDSMDYGIVECAHEAILHSVI